MKQGSSNCFRQNPLSPLPHCPVEEEDHDKDDIIVSQILLDLKPLMSLSESLSNFNWARRKRRSCLDSSIPTPKHKIQPPQIKDTTTSAARTTASPDTPLSLSFSPSESDEKPHKKRKRGEYVDIIQELNQRKGLLQGEIESVKNFYQKLKKFNSKLKAIRHEVLNSCTRKEEETQMEKGKNFGMELTQRYRMNTLHRYPPLIADPTAQRFRCSYGPITSRLTSSNNGLGPDSRPAPGPVSHLVRLSIDLNLPAEEMDASQPLDVTAEDRRARFAEARRKRRGIIKIKAMRNACGIKFPINT